MLRANDRRVDVESIGVLLQHRAPQTRGNVVNVRDGRHLVLHLWGRDLLCVFGG